MNTTTSTSSVTTLDKVPVPNVDEAYQVLRLLYYRGPVRIYLCKHITTNQLVVVKHTRHSTPSSTRKHLVSKSPKHQKLIIPRGGPNENTPPLILHLSPDSIDQERLVAQLIQSRGGHRHILKYYDVSFTNNATTPQDTYLMMEYCKHGDLFTLLEQQPTQRFDEATALHFFYQIVQGVHFLHQSIGIAHRDLSLENILIDDQGCLKICDFGMSTMANRRSNETVGKLFYMAPEIVAGQFYDPIQADIWSLGIVLFIMLTGSPLYHIADPSDRAWKGVGRIGIGGLIKQWGLDHHISSSTIALLTAMLQVNPSKRLTSLDGVVQHLMNEH